MDTQEQRKRKVMIAFAAIFFVAVAAFVVTMSMTTSYPSVPAAAALARPEPIDVPPIAPDAAPVVAAHADAAAPRARVGEGAPPDAPETGAPSGEGGRQARGSVLVDDGAAPRSPGQLRSDLGTLAKEDVKAGVGAVKDKVRDCYERGLAIDPALAGTVKVSFTLEANEAGKGVVTKGEIAESDMKSIFFEACVLKEVAAAEFKAPGGGGVVNVTYPFKFASTADDAVSAP